ncbi:MAG: acyloxyacyl hydrolase [Bacteroidales bacterium]|nr:acyloxyacyl hydrolase [Bacteroidales bacterium]
MNYTFKISNYIFNILINNAKAFNKLILHSYLSVGKIAFLFFIISVSGFSQKNTVSKNDVIFSYNYHNGSISQKEYSYPLKRSHYAEFGFLWQTNGKKQWHHDYHFPEVGFGLAIGNHGNDTIYGNSIAVYPIWRYRIFERKYFKMSARLAIGLAYFFNPYNRLENPYNYLIGSRINNYTSFGLLFHFTPHKNISINAGANLFHYSAAHALIPNLGLNDMPLTLGISYKIGQTERKAFAPKDSASKKLP